MKSSKTESIFKRIDNCLKSLPENQREILFTVGIVVSSLLTFLIYKEYFPSEKMSSFDFTITIKSEEEIKADKISSIKETMDVTVIQRMSKDIEVKLATSYKEMWFRTLSMSKNIYSKELCESYNSVAFCAELKAEFVESINKTADRKILEANVDREYELKKLEN